MYRCARQGLGIVHDTGTIFGEAGLALSDTGDIVEGYPRAGYLKVWVVSAIPDFVKCCLCSPDGITGWD